ncbi:unnamed protein product [Coffea canephora]|uniref:DH200=94 genomic scaffold, scaffold_165 n=1 Tax=Coffea canephora TaxID=49390 RepID=A0A068VCU5_COFCA|nr:unnamed protein product [Coffea canephora]
MQYAQLLNLLELLECLGTSLSCVAHSTILFSLTGFDVTAPPPPRAYPRVRRVACPALSGTQSFTTVLN